MIYPFFLFFFGKFLFKSVFCRVFGDGGRVFPGKAGIAQIAAADKVFKLGNGQISEAVGSDNIGNFGNRMVAGDKVVAGVDIRSVIARIEKRRRRNPEMNFFCPGFP